MISLFIHKKCYAEFKHIKDFQSYLTDYKERISLQAIVIPEFFTFIQVCTSNQLKTSSITAPFQVTFCKKCICLYHWKFCGVKIQYPLLSRSDPYAFAHLSPLHIYL